MLGIWGCGFIIYTSAACTRLPTAIFAEKSYALNPLLKYDRIIFQTASQVVKILVTGLLNTTSTMSSMITVPIAVTILKNCELVFIGVKITYFSLFHTQTLIASF